jgi:hypothetical protein
MMKRKTVIRNTKEFPQPYKEYLQNPTTNFILTSERVNASP